jgi:malate dehydrogenase
MPKISIIGAGNVGATCAQRLLEKGIADIVLVDIVEGLPQGKALDMMQSAPVCGFDTAIIGTNDFSLTAGSDVVIVTSGIARKPGMTRDQLIKTNAGIITEVIGKIAPCSPGCVIIIVTNPVDAMTYLALKTSGFPRERVLGLSGVLDSARFSTFIAAELGVPVSEVSSIVMGEHGQNMVVIPRLAKANGKPITALLPPETIEKLKERAVNGGAEIVGLLKTGSAFYAPSASAARMAEAIIRDRKEILPCAAYLQGEYGLNDVVIGAPVRLGRGGIEKIINLGLENDELAALKNSAEAVKKTISLL